MNIVLLHGLAGNPQVWGRVRPLLHAADGVEAPHLTMTGGVVGEAERLGSGLSAPTLLVGHSMGALVATEVAARYPGRIGGIVVINPPTSTAARIAANGPRESALSAPVLGPILWRVAPKSALRRGLTSAFAPGYEVPDEFVNALKATPYDVFVRSQQAIASYLAERPLGHRLARLNRPVRAVIGLADGRVDSDRAQRDLEVAQNITIRRLVGVGHSPIWESPADVADEIAQAAVEFTGLEFNESAHRAASARPQEG